MNEAITQASTILISGGLLLWFGKILFEKSIQARLDLEKDKLNMVRHADLEYKKSQIQYLYGPLYGILKTNRKIYDLWMDEQFGEINLKVKKLFSANNEKANKIIIDNAHLIDVSPMPEYFVKYSTSSLVWSMYCADTNEGVLPKRLANHPDIKWCEEFEDHIFETYERLARELSGLYEKYDVK